MEVAYNFSLATTHQLFLHFRAPEYLAHTSAFHAWPTITSLFNISFEGKRPLTQHLAIAHSLLSGLALGYYRKVALQNLELEKV